MYEGKITYGEDGDDFPPTFSELLASCTLIQKKAMLVALSKSIKSDIHKRSRANVDHKQYVQLVKGFLPDDYLDDAIIAEVEELGLFKNSNKPLTQWLSSDPTDYCFSDNKRLSHPSKDIRKYHNICKLMDTVNKNPNTTQNADSALIIVYNTKHAGIDFHNDNEKLIDSSSSISTITFGSSRDIEFCNQGIRPRFAQHTVEAGHHDLMIMKPGCQEQLVHRVCQGKSHQNTDDEWRVVISFRKITRAMEQDSEISFNKDENPLESSVKSEKKIPPQSRVNLIVGDSFSVGLDCEKLGRKGRKKVVNLSKGGATIKEVSFQLDTFFLSNSQNNVVVDKVFVCVGTNDIRNCREKGVRHLKSPLIDLAEQIKVCFPVARVWFQNLIPLPLQNEFTVRNIEQYNVLLFEICSFTKTFYFDIFRKFLIYDYISGYSFRDELLFINSNNIHLNKRGLGILARCYLHLIHSNCCNPLGY